MRLILKDQTEIDGGQAGIADHYLWLTFGGMSLQEAAIIFFNPEKTGVIVFQYGEMYDTYKGYTECVNLYVDGDSIIHVCMVQGVTE